MGSLRLRAHWASFRSHCFLRTTEDVFFGSNDKYAEGKNFFELNEQAAATPWMDWKLMAIIAITMVSTLLVVIVLGLCYLKCRGAEAPKAPENTPKPKPRVGVPLTPRVVKK